MLGCSDCLVFLSVSRFERNGQALLVLLPSEEEHMVQQLQEKKIPIKKIRCVLTAIPLFSSLSHSALFHLSVFANSCLLSVPLFASASASPSLISFLLCS